MKLIAMQEAPMPSVVVNLPPDEHARLQTIAKHLRLPIRSLVRMILIVALAKEVPVVQSDERTHDDA